LDTDCGVDQRSGESEKDAGYNLKIYKDLINIEPLPVRAPK
jgi:hypothetical protein